MGVNVVWMAARRGLKMISLGIWSRRRIVRSRRRKWHLMVRLLAIALNIALTMILLPVVILALGFLLLDSFIKYVSVPLALSTIELAAVEFIAAEHIILG